MADPLIGRDEELNAVRAFLSTSRDGPALVLLDGDAGIGKTSVWEAAIAAEGPGRRVLRARPAEAEMALSFAALSDLMAGLLDTALPGLPEPQRRALEVALLLQPGGERPPEPRAVAAGFLAAIGELALANHALLAACGADNEEPRETSKAPQLASASVIDGDPYAIACGHVRNQQKWADVTRRATVALSDSERIAGLSRLQATQSIFFAMTELCKGSPASQEPARTAVQAVRQGKYRADLGAP